LKNAEFLSGKSLYVYRVMQKLLNTGSQHVERRGSSGFCAAVYSNTWALK